MCGIIWAKGQAPVKDIVLERFNEQRLRGLQGFGFLAIEDGKVKVYRSETEKDIEKYLKKSNSTEILFHHRYPTSTPNFVEATHPIRVRHKELKYDYYVVHNGIISNDGSLKKEHEKLGFKYTTRILQQWITRKQTYETHQFNDSEALAIELAMYIENKKFKIETQGAAAVMAMQVDKETKEPIALFYGTNGGNPLMLHRNKKDGYTSISSQYKNEKKATSIKRDILYKLDYATGKITSHEVDIGGYHKPTSSYTGGFPRGGYADYDDEWDDIGRRRNKTKSKALAVIDIDGNEKVSDNTLFEDIDDERFMALAEDEAWWMEVLEDAKRANDYDIQMEAQAELDDVREALLAYGYEPAENEK